MKPIEVAIEYGLKLKQFESLEKAEEHFFSLIEYYRIELKKLFSMIFNTNLEYSFSFLNNFDKIIKISVLDKKYELLGLTLEEFDRAIGVYFGDLAVKNRYGKWIVREDGFVKNRYNLGIQEANGHSYLMGMQLTSNDYNTNGSKAVALKIFTEKFHIAKVFKSNLLKKELIDSINNFNDKRYSAENQDMTISKVEIANFKNFDIIPHVTDIEEFLTKEKHPYKRDVIYYYLQYYCWETQNRKVCQFLIDRLKFEESTPVRKQFFWNRLDIIKNLNSYDITELLRIANDEKDKNSKNCQSLLKKHKISYH